MLPRPPATATPALFMSYPRLLLIALLSILGVSLPGSSATPPTRPWISEIYYHPPDTNWLAQWIEIHNPAAVSVDVSGWRLEGGIAFTLPPGTVVPEHAELVIAADAAVFSQRYPEVHTVVGGWSGVLSRDGETLRLVEPAGAIADEVHFAVGGDWAQRRLAAPDGLNRRGWEWFADHDGGGASLELINPDLPHGNGQNWGASRGAGGTPGKPNSRQSPDAAPLVEIIRHAPVIPKSTDPVTISARVLDEATTAPQVTAHWRVDGTPTFTEVPMQDDGAHGDALPADGVFGAILPAQADHTVVEFYLTARDTTGNVRTVPDVAPTDTGRTAHFLYQVDNSTYAGNQPVLRLITTLSESNYLATQVWSGAPFSDAAISGTFIHADGLLDEGGSVQFRYLCDFRNRGHGTRTAVPHNFHVGFPPDQPWRGRSGLNLNSHYSYSQHLGSAVFRRAGIPMADSHPVQLRYNGVSLAKTGPEQYGSYAANESFDGRLVSRQFPDDPGGNLYRGIRDMIPGVPAAADLAWHGPVFTGYTNAYAKENHALVNDWSDLIDLIDTLQNSSDAEYVRRVRTRLDADQWMRYFAANTLIGNQENSLGNGSGDDFGLYRGVQDPRFRLLTYDMDSILGRGSRDTTYGDGLWRATNVNAVARLLKHPAFVPAYFRQLRELADTVFAPAQMNPLIDHLLGGYVESAAIQNFKAFNASQREYVLGLIPSTLSIQTSLPLQSGYPHTTAATVDLHGTTDAMVTHEVRVNGRPATYSAWEGRWTVTGIPLTPGVQSIRVEAFDEAGAVVGRAQLDVWREARPPVGVSGSVRQDTTWLAAEGPYQVTSDLTVAAGVTLTIEPGTTVYLGNGVNLTVANGGRLLAEGRENAPIRFTRAPGSGGSWGGVVIQGGAGSPETRISWAHFEFHGTTTLHSSGGTVFLDHLTFGTFDHQYLSLDDSSFVVSHCVFPNPSTSFEPIHGTGGVKAGGHGIFYRNFCGLPIGYSDVIDFTGGNRPGQPLVHFLDNVFMGASDDILDLDGTDAWVEGNIFLHTHKNGTPDSSSAISGGNDGSRTSEVTIVNNLFFDVDQALTMKQGNFYTFVQNTVVHQTKQGGLDVEAAVFNFADDGTTSGAGLYAEGNLLVDLEQLTRNLTPGSATAAATYLTNNLSPLEWTGAGGNNSPAAPLLAHLPTLAETQFQSWEEAQILRTWLQPQPGSPARGRGIGGQDLGGVQPLGVTLSGVPTGTNATREATISVGFRRNGHGIPTGGFPEGSGYPAYRWRLDHGAWSAETPIDVAIQLTQLTDGPHFLEVSGKRDTGLYQDDPLFGELAFPTRTETWYVDGGATAPLRPTLRLDEVLAANTVSFAVDGATPDFVELHNFGYAAVDLGGLGLSDDPTQPYRFRFPPGTSLAAGERIVLLADQATASSGLHLGFTLNAHGGTLTLRDRDASATEPLDQLTFGVQIPDLSLGRGPDGVWVLGTPSPGAPTVPVELGDARDLRINEWLAQARFASDHDFVELFNLGTRPVALGGLRLSDAAGAPDRHVVAPLSFIAARGFVSFIADGDPEQGAHHLGFKLSPEVGWIRLGLPDGSLLDAVNYDAQRTDASEGRTPNGATVFGTFAHPTPGASNPGAGSEGTCTPVTETFTLLPLAAHWRYQQTANLDGVDWKAKDFNDASWPEGPGLFAAEDCNCLPSPGIGTPLTIGRLTYYFRTHFTVDRDLAGFQLNLRVVLDDGAIVWLNGKELTRIGMNSGDQPYANRASRNVSDAALEILTLPPDLLVSGTNTLAVEVHQTSSSSSDVVWGMGLEASRTSTTCEPVRSSPLVLNELLANHAAVDEAPTGPHFDYLELHNPSTNRVDLAGLSVTDDPGFPRKFVFGAGDTLAPGDSLVLACDSGQPISPTNTAFALPAAGGSVFLFDKPTLGGALIDSLTYGLQAQGFSLGRVPNGVGPWTLGTPTPGAANHATALASVSQLRINEWLADPAQGPDWFEIHNLAEEPVALGGLTLTDDLSVPAKTVIAPLSFVGTGARAYVRFIADGQSQGTADHVAFSLKASGEALGIFSPNGTLLDGLQFGAQARGISEGRLPEDSASIVRFLGTSSPGTANYLRTERVVIHEVLAHTDPPFEDAIEIHNPTAQPVDLSGWYLGNGREPLRKFRIPNGTLLPAGGYHVWYEAEFNAGLAPFTLNSAHGDTITLVEADATGQLTGYRAQEVIGPTANGVSWGRIATSTGFDFGPLERTTFGEDQPKSVEEFRRGPGLPNAAPRLGPLVLNEVMFHPRSLAPLASEDPNDEFVEVKNLSGEPLPLFDAAHPTNTWALRGAITFAFPPQVVLPPGALALVVPFATDDLARVATFRAHYALSPSVPLFGPWSGRLDNDGERLELVRPDPPQEAPHPDAGFVPYPRVDAVAFAPTAPWPDADGNGFSLQRRVPQAYGNDPASWRAAAPTPGADTVSDDPLADTDGDGLTDAWERQYFGDLARDGSGDFDGDGVTDREEFQAGTSPTNRTDVLRFTGVRLEGGSCVLTLPAVPGRSYTVQVRDASGDGAWQRLSDVPPGATATEVEVRDTLQPAGARLYRIVTPRLP